MGWSDNPSKTVEKWLGEYEGSLMCDCDHGCRQWVRKNSTKNALLIRVLTKVGSSTNPNKIVQLDNKKADKIFLRIIRGEGKRRMREMKKNITS